MRQTVKAALVCVVLFGSGQHFLAFGSGDEESVRSNEIKSLNWKKHPSVADVGSMAIYEVDSGFMFLEDPDANKFMRLTENTGDSIGILVPEEGSWWASFEFHEIGYVKDDEKDSLDSVEILKQLRSNQKADNKERRRRGWPELENLNWMRKPHYDERTHNLEWGVKFTESGSGNTGVNYQTRILGRKGVMSVTLVCSPELLEDALPQFKEALKNFKYKAGNKYSEFRSGDRIAEIGLAALIGGGLGAAAVKSGALKWLWKVIVVAFVAIGGLFSKIKKFFVKDNGAPPAEDGPEDVSEDDGETEDNKGSTIGGSDK